MTATSPSAGLVSPERLSPRERQVLRELVGGGTYHAIARRLNLSRHTVDTYLRRIRAKTGAHSRIVLLRLALTLAEEDARS